GAGGHRLRPAYGGRARQHLRRLPLYGRRRGGGQRLRWRRDPGRAPAPAGRAAGREHRLRLTVDGQAWQEGALADLGDPVAWVIWAADKAVSLGRGLRRGDLLLLGAPCAAVALPTAGA